MWKEIPPSQEQKLCFAYNYAAIEYFYVKTKDAIPAGHHFLSMQFEPTGKPDFAQGKGAPGTVVLLAHGKEVGRGELPVTTPNRLAQGGAMLVGADTGSAVVADYKAPFRFTGTIKRVIVDVSGEHETAVRVFLAQE